MAMHRCIEAWMHGNDSLKFIVCGCWIIKEFLSFCRLLLSFKTLRFYVRMKQLTNEVYMDPARAYSIELVAKL